MGFRIGITMRETQAPNYFEPRDSLAHDWPKYLNAIFPNDMWMYIPNMGKDAIELFDKWSLNVLILSGGENIGESSIRDETEELLLKHAIELGIPIIGVCRGLQLIHTFFGGEINLGDDNFVRIHRATKHNIKLNNSIKEVNSYHNNFLVKETLPNQFKVWATGLVDDSIEGIKSENILAMMWHPERDKEIPKWNKDIIIEFLNNKKWLED